VSVEKKANCEYKYKTEIKIKIAKTIIKVEMIKQVLPIAALFLIFTGCVLAEEFKNTQINESNLIQLFDNPIYIEDEEMKIIICLNKTYKPGDSIRAEFFITNKNERIVDTINIGLDVYYLGKRVFSYSHPSWREYKQNETIHIYKESKLPLLTPPGTYKLKFYIKPVGQKLKIGETTISVIPTPMWYAIVTTLIISMVVSLLLLKKYWIFINRYYLSLSVGQRFVFIATIFLIISALILASGLENIANKSAILAYYCLVVGVGNLIFEEVSTRKIDNPIREGIGMYAVSVLAYFSKNELTLWVPISFAIVGSIILLNQRKRKQ